MSRLLLALAFLLPLSVIAAEQAPRLGWHGETMPSGLVRGAEEGEYVWTKDKSVMVFVPPGSFPMGSADGPKDEQPVHRVELSGYYIDKYEVTWGQWKASGLKYNESVESRIAEPRAPDWGIIDDHPVLNVTWYDAKDYVAWAGKRLPTEAEWEKAARGTDGRKYPWGSDPPNFERAIWVDHPVALESTAPVNCCAGGVSPYGVFNLAGNVYEWCEDVYERDYYSRSPAVDPVNTHEKGRYRVLRGGALVLEIEDLSSTLRYRLLPVDRTPYIGFRAALSLVARSLAEPTPASSP